MVFNPAHTLLRGPAHTLLRGLLVALGCVAVAAAVAACGGSTAGASSPPRSDSPSSAKVPVVVHVAPHGATAVLVPVYINGRGPFRFVLDTGASRSIVDQHLARRLGFNIQPSHKQLTGVNATKSAGRIVVSHWRIGRVQLPAERVLTLSLASDTRGRGLGGLIGSDNLRRFGSFLLDYSGRVLTLRPHRAG